jgi:5-methylcytosine-specific restriction protein A
MNLNTCPFQSSIHYKRSKLHDQYGGQSQGGISTPKNSPFLMIFTGPKGQQHGYFDEEGGDGVLIYTGEGQYGDMRFVAGNRAIRDHASNGKAIYVFRQRQTKKLCRVYW